MMTTSDSSSGGGAAAVALAMDWGGTWARAAVVDRQGRLLWQNRVANAPGATQDALLAAAGSLLLEAKSHAGSRPIAGAGIALAGAIDAAAGTLLSSPNLPALNGVALPEVWAPLLDLPVWVDNDANLAALGEYCYGAGRPNSPQARPARTLVYVTFSTGVGAGIVDRGAVFAGAAGAAGEVGHMTIDCRADAPLCACGNRGCLEALASGTAIGRSAQARLGEAAPGSPLRRAYEANATLTGETVFAAAAQGDPVAVAAVDAAVGAIIVGLGNVLNLFNPDVVVLGGGVTQGLLALNRLESIEAGIRSRAISAAHRDFRLAIATLGDSQGMVGAASLVWSQYDRQGPDA